MIVVAGMINEIAGMINEIAVVEVTKLVSHLESLMLYVP